MDNTQKNIEQTILCPECDSPIAVQTRIEVGSVVECQKCGSQSEVLILSPLKLSVLEEEK